VHVLDGLRVVDRTTQIAGPYCTKLLADAGADVVKVEPVDGDPLRGWRSGALFEYLNASKRSVIDDSNLVGRADVLVTEGPVDVAGLRAANPALIVVTITPFGLDGPWAARAATEFTLQAACGSTGSRGLPERSPLPAGGRLGEWITGTYAAVATLAAVPASTRSGEGEHIDVAMLDCMAVAMTTYPSVFSSFLGWPPINGTGRSIEVPSIEPTRDGHVVFTTNSAQQFQDFLVLIGRSDLIGDAQLANAARRFRRRTEFLASVHEYTMKRSSTEVLEEAAALRIPSGPVLDGATVAGLEQFRTNGVMEESPSGRFRQPRIPYRIGGVLSRRPAPAPELGRHTGSIQWPAQSRPAPSGNEAILPLDGIRVIDCTAWWAGPAATHVLACLGADVIKVESTKRPDLMRYTSTQPHTVDQWWEWGPLFHGVNVGKRGVTIDLSRAEGRTLFEDLLGTADVLVENYTPRVMADFGFGWDRVHTVNPRLIMVRMPAFGLDGPWRDHPGFAQTVEGITGMASVTGYPDGPPMLPRGACDPLAGMHAVFATLLALEARHSDGMGRMVECPLVEAALNVAAEQLIEYDAGGVTLTREGARSEVAAPQGVYQCAGDDRWVAVAVADDKQWAALREVAGWEDDPALASGEGRRAAHDELDARLAEWCGGRDAEEVADVLTEAGVPSAVVIAAPDVLHNPQLRHRGLFETEDHPVTGRHELPTMPFRFSGVRRWLSRPSPTLGQHNDEVLVEVRSTQELAALRTAGIVGERVAGL
jgi:crotonobetainyl-CoA:carnitine CoA-transferase CaiB-like acyl-CoA transferase